MSKQGNIGIHLFSVHLDYSKTVYFSVLFGMSLFWYNLILVGLFKHEQLAVSFLPKIFN